MSVASIYARQDGTIAHIDDGMFPFTPDANTSLVIQFTIDSYKPEYQHIADNSKAAFWDGANLQIDNVVYLDSAWITARQAELDTRQQKEAAQQILLANAKVYLSAQLAAPNPNITTIYNTVKAHVDSNPLLQQMVTNQITICSNSLTWVLNLVTPTALDRQRYLLCVQLVISTIA